MKDDEDDNVWYVRNGGSLTFNIKVDEDFSFLQLDTNDTDYNFSLDIEYKIKVKSYSRYPFDTAEIHLNSVGGVEPSVWIANNSNKTIKYVDFYAYFYNAVGDMVSNDIGGRTYASLRITGPLKPWKRKMYSWDAVFYNYSVRKMLVKKVKITYMDGSVNMLM